jgi:hypothetical protein
MMDAGAKDVCVKLRYRNAGSLEMNSDQSNLLFEAPSKSQRTGERAATINTIARKVRSQIRRRDILNPIRLTSDYADDLDGYPAH